jgi:large subunit ribosomal protein L34
MEDSMLMGGQRLTIYAVDTLSSTAIFSASESRRRAGGGVAPWKNAATALNHYNEMKRQYQPSKIRRKRQHGFLNRNSSKNGKATLRNRRRVGRHRLTPV